MGLKEKPVKLIYLHGFNSSSDSHKARLLFSYMQQHDLHTRIDIPDISPYPDKAICDLRKCIEENQQYYQVALAGSSLGGFYATVLAERYELSAVLVNPAVRPHRLLEKYIGENINYNTSEHWMLNTSHIEQLRFLDVEPVTEPDRYMLMLQTGDETLDYRDAELKYAGCHVYIEQAGSHAFDNFERHIPRILAFCGLNE